MSLLKGLMIALSMYSRIPVPTVEWDQKSMRYVMCFFPLVGVIIGLVTLGYGTYFRPELNDIAGTAGYLLIPVLLSGGIHLDGFLDTADALSSHRSPEEKRRILKDPHCGAFAVIAGITLFVFLAGVWSSVTAGTLPMAALSFVLSRALSGLSVTWFPCASDSGLAYSFQSGAQKRTCRVVLLLEILAVCGAAIWLDPVQAAGMMIAAGLIFALYYRVSLKEFGGITGDLAGWFLQLAEAFMILGILLAGGIGR